uniref:Calreticulin n=1 Tax=Oxyrrhis marina TaxID=2969 RepID=A0A7S3XGN1_OXYMA
MENKSAFNSDSEYNIMFGPDKCGFNQRTHLIFNNGKDNVLKTDDLDYKQGDTKSHVYRLTLRANDSVKVEVDGEEIFDGSIEENWKIGQPAEIDDPEDVKPDDWVDSPMMDDPEDKKPEDWVEEAQIPDEKATKPEDWDEEEDGEWERPMIENPDYKGPWNPKRIANPLSFSSSASFFFRSSSSSFALASSTSLSFLNSSMSSSASFASSVIIKLSNNDPDFTCHKSIMTVPKSYLWRFSRGTYSGLGIFLGAHGPL